MVRGCLGILLACACILGACSGPVIEQSAQGFAAYAQAVREPAPAEPTSYPLSSFTPAPNASDIPAPDAADIPAPLSAQALLDGQAAADDARAQGDVTYIGEPEPTADVSFETEVYTFAQIDPDERFADSRSYASIPALFEVNDAFLAGMPFETLSQGDMAAVTRAITELGYQAQSISITHKTQLLISCLVNTGRAVLPVNVNCQTGEIVKLADFFTREDTGWRGLIPDIVMNAAAEHGLTLLCDVPPADGAHPCFVLDGSIVLLYRPYEIATYEAGSPCFTLPMRELSQYTTGAFGIGG